MIEANIRVYILQCFNKIMRTINGTKSMQCASNRSDQIANVCMLYICAGAAMAAARRN